MWDTSATNNAILYLQYKTCNSYLQWDTYTTNSAILHALHIDRKNNQTNSYLHYLQYGLHTLQKPENKGGEDVW